MSHSIGFVDVGFLKAGGAKALKVNLHAVTPNAAGCVSLLRDLAQNEGSKLLRVYWYDGAFESTDPRYSSQRKYLDAISSCPGIQIRLGHLRISTPTWHNAVRAALAKVGTNLADFEQHFQFRDEMEQKGVDTLIVLDLVRLAQRRAYDTAFLLAGDRDPAEAVRVSQDEGRKVVLLHPAAGGVATELRHLADEVLPLDASQLGRMLTTKSMAS